MSTPVKPPAKIDSTRLPQTLAQLPWPKLTQTLAEQGFVTTGQLLSPKACQALAARYHDPATAFRSRIVMERYAFGQGEYQYFSYPLPAPIATLRQAIYPHLAPVANHWHELMGLERRFPAELEAFLAECHAAGQTRPTPLLLKYESGDYNCLHQDLYGAHVFPLQLTLLLSQPGSDFSGGEFVLVEQRPRMQSRVRVVPLQQGEAVIFCVNQRPVQGKRGHYRVTLRHGVSPLLSGQRFTAGIPFHDAG